MDLQTVLIWIVIGAIAGVLAESMVGGPRRSGLGTAILIGILGAFIGGWLFSALGIASALASSGRSSPHSSAQLSCY